MSYSPAGLGRVLALTPREFEHEVGRYLVDHGYRDVVRVGGAGDLGVDLHCRDSVGRLVAVQCKRYAPERPIGAPAIQAFFGMLVHHGAELGLYVTTSRYTAPAADLARQRDIVLIDGAALDRWDRQRWEREQARLRREAEEQRRRELEERRRRELRAQQRVAAAPSTTVSAHASDEHPSFSLRYQEWARLDRERALAERQRREIRLDRRIATRTREVAATPRTIGLVIFARIATRTRKVAATLRTIGLVIFAFAFLLLVVGCALFAVLATWQLWDSDRLVAVLAGVSGAITVIYFAPMLKSGSEASEVLGGIWALGFFFQIWLLLARFGDIV